MNLAGTTRMIASPNKRRRPVATRQRPVVLHRSGRAANIYIWFLVFRAAQKPVTHLHRPVLVRHKTETNRTRIPLVSIKVITILVGLATIEDRSFELQPTIGESSCKHPKANMRRVLQVVRERGRGIL